MSNKRLNVLILAAGSSGDNSNKKTYPNYLTEVGGFPLIQLIVKGLEVVPSQNFYYCFLNEDVRTFHLNNLIQVLTPGAQLVKIQKGIKGSAATALMAMASMNSDNELLIVSTNEWVKEDLIACVQKMRDDNLDAGTLIFRSVHPRYSYVRLNEAGLVVEAAQRNPISHHATAGVFWFKETKEIMTAIQTMIHKDVQIDGGFYIAPALNQMLLKNARVGIVSIDGANYHPFKDENQHLIISNSLSTFDTSLNFRDGSYLTQ